MSEAAPPSQTGVSEAPAALALLQQVLQLDDKKWVLFQVSKPVVGQRRVPARLLWVPRPLGAERAAPGVSLLRVQGGCGVVSARQRQFSPDGRGQARRWRISA